MKSETNGLLTSQSTDDPNPIFGYRIECFANSEDCRFLIL